ncbi:TnsD family Tn7-like transposition protein [Cupriavidus taiwanensis]
MAESAASLSIRAMGHPPLQRKGGRLCAPDLANGTVSWPVDILAALGNGFYGTSDEILDTQSLFNYCAIAMRPEGRVALRKRARTGVGSAKEASWAPWQLATVGQTLACPICRREAWRMIGMPAECWPHRAPLVLGCWRHGVLLVAQEGFADLTVQAKRSCRASQDILTFAQNTVRLCGLARNFSDTADHFRKLLAEADFLRDDGRFYAARFRAAYATYGSNHAHEPALRKAIQAPQAGRAVLDWVRSAGEESVHPVYLVLALGMLDEVVASPAASFAPRKCGVQVTRRRAWSARTVQSLRVLDGRSHYGRSDIPYLAAHGCEPAEIASLCRLSRDIVWRTVRVNKLRPLIQKARHERLRHSARQAWQRARVQHPNRSSNVLRSLEPRAFRWLWKHDRIWLQSQRAEFTPVTGWRRQVLPTAGSRQRILAKLRQAAASQQARGGRCTRASLTRALSITPYILKQWAQASAEVAELLDHLTQSARVPRR